MVVGSKREINRESPRPGRPKEKRAGYEITTAVAEDIAWIARLEADSYAPEDAVPEHVLAEWFSVNPTGFNIVRAHDGHRVGHIDILPLRPAALSAFAVGKIIEREIRGDFLYTPAERDLIHDLYVESVIIPRAEGCSNAPAVRHVLLNLIAVVERICDPSKVKNTYAVAASKAGERGLKHLGFDRLKSGHGKPDRHDLFVAKFPVLAARLSALKTNRTRGVSSS